jgi:hypothetical protein
MADKLWESMTPLEKDEHLDRLQVLIDKNDTEDTAYCFVLYSADDVQVCSNGDKREAIEALQEAIEILEQEILESN